MLPLTMLTLISEPLQHALIEADNVADSEDSEDEWNYFRVNPNKQESAVSVAADESCKDVEEQSAQENPESVAKDSSEIESSKPEKNNKCEESDTSLSELIDIHVSIYLVVAFLASTNKHICRLVSKVHISNNTVILSDKRRKKVGRTEKGLDSPKPGNKERTRKHGFPIESGSSRVCAVITIITR